MRVVGLTVGVFVASMCTASAQAGMPPLPQFKWCHVEQPDYMYSCLYRSIEECRLEIPGLGGFCNLNPRYVEPAAKPMKTSRRKSSAR
jgi:hypothetical protein